MLSHGADTVSYTHLIFGNQFFQELDLLSSSQFFTIRILLLAILQPVSYTHLYINGVYSCRGIADALKYDVRYMWICGDVYKRQILDDVECFPHGLLFWRSLTQWKNEVLLLCVENPPVAVVVIA